MKVPRFRAALLLMIMEHGLLFKSPSGNSLNVKRLDIQHTSHQPDVPDLPRKRLLVYCQVLPGMNTTGPHNCVGAQKSRLEPGKTPGASEALPMRALQALLELRDSASSFHWLSSSIFSCSFVRPSRIVTPHLISTI